MFNRKYRSNSAMEQTIKTANQSENYNTPLTYYVQQLINENTKLKEALVEVGKMRLEQKQLRKELYTECEKADNNTEKYTEMKNIVDGLAEIQKYKESLDEYAKKLNEEREQLETEKLNFQQMKNNFTFNQAL